MRPSFLGQVHPTTRLLCLVGSFVPPFLTDRPWDLWPMGLLLLLGLADTRAWGAVRRASPVLTVLLVLSVVLWTFFRPTGPLLFAWGPMAIHQDGCLYGLTTGLRLWCFILATLTYLACTPIEDFTLSLSRVGVPWAMSFALSLAFRLTPLFMDTGRTILEAQRARGLDLEGAGPWGRVVRTVPVIVPILVSGLRRADQLAIALESRGFGRGGRRSTLARHTVGWRDWILPLLLGAATVAVGM